MSPTISTSFLPVHAEAGIKLLRRAGLADPALSNSNMLGPAELASKMCSVYLKKRNDSVEMLEPDQIGRAWQIQAAEIFVANAEQDHWGWGDSKGLPLFEFWARFEPAAKFALFYTEPSAILEHIDRLENESNAQEVVETHLARWRNFNDRMLRFYNKFEDRCFLANLHSISANPNSAQNALSQKLQLDPSDSENFETDAGVILPQSEIRSFLAPLVAAQENSANTLFDELEATADIRGPHGTNMLQDFTGVIGDYLLARETLTDTKKQVELLQTEAIRNNDRIVAKETESELLLFQLEQVQQELETLVGDRQTDFKGLEDQIAALEASKKASVDALEGDLISIRNDLTKARAEKTAFEERIELLDKALAAAKQEMVDEKLQSGKRIKELDEKRKQLETEIRKVRMDVSKFEDTKTENEQLLLQLEQVQEELRYQVDQSSSGSQVVASNGAAQSDSVGGPKTASYLGREERLSGASDNAHIDMRHLIRGSNWHEAERDGRWGGPGTQSSVKLPALTKGRYSLTINVVDAMSRKIFDDTQVIVGGKNLPIKRRIRTKGNGVLAQIKRARAHLNPAVAPYPATLTVSFSVENDQSMTELLLKFPQSISPAERGETDSRKLTARIADIRIVRL